MIFGFVAKFYPIGVVIPIFTPLSFGPSPSGLTCPENPLLTISSAYYWANWFNLGSKYTGSTLYEIRSSLIRSSITCLFCAKVAGWTEVIAWILVMGGLLASKSGTMGIPFWTYIGLFKTANPCLWFIYKM